MLADFGLQEIDRLNRVVEEERARMRTLIELLHLAGVEVWFNPDGCIVVNEALEAPYPIGAWPWCRMWGTNNIGLGEGYMGLGAGGT